MNDNEKAINFETLTHIMHVRNILGEIITELIQRAKKHDQSKLNDPELSVFVEYTPKLAKSTYGSDEYKQFLQEMKPALDHHYRNNRHHPEHFLDGIDGMNLIDIVEMYCDWMAATLRHNDGNMEKSIEINKTRFNMSDQLANIFMNTLLRIL